MPTPIRSAEGKGPGAWSHATGGSLSQEAEAAADLALCVRVRQGDESAFAELYRRHVDWATRTATRMIGPDSAEDIVSETFASLLSTLRRGGGPVGGVRGYLRTVMRRQSGHVRADAARSIPAEELSLLLTEPDRLRQEDLAVDSPEEVVLERSDDAAARQAFTLLSPRNRRVIELVELRGMSYREAAAELGMTVGYLGRRLHLARRELFDGWVGAHVLPVDAPGEHPSALEIARQITGNHGPRLRRRVTAHLTECSACRRRVDLVDLGQRQAPSWRAAALGWLALLPAWFRRTVADPRRLLVGWTRRGLVWTSLAAAGTAVLLTVVLMPGQIASEAPTSSAGVAGTSVGQASTAASPRPSDARVEWLPGASLSGHQDGDVVVVPFQIEATGSDARTLTLTVTSAPGVEIEEPYAFCSTWGGTLVCPRLGPVGDGQTISGQLTLRVTDARTARLPALRVERG
ncbi:RNA polymerase sigma factor [Cellulomonas sp. NPDC089187]|uniref:RNA polymerase sigma factor n=1 Tax=Cellulomonas sp. NPDC089187 TaxID=3154970 RepID=UPI00342D9260